MPENQTVDYLGPNPFSGTIRRDEFWKGLVFAGATARVLAGEANAEAGGGTTGLRRVPRTYLGTNIPLPDNFEDIMAAVDSGKMTNPDDLYNACYANSPKFSPANKEDLLKALQRLREEKEKKKPQIETAAERRAKKERERLEGVQSQIVRECNLEIQENSKWSPLKLGGPAKIDSEVDIKAVSGGGLEFSMKNRDGTKAQACFKKELVAGKYIVTLDGTPGKIVAYWNGGREIPLIPGKANTIEVPGNLEIYFNVIPDRINPKITLKNFMLGIDQRVAGP